MSNRDKALIQWFRLELRVSQVELRRILDVSEGVFEGRVRSKEHFFNAREFIHLLASWKSENPVRAELLTRKIQRDLPEIDISDVLEIAELIA